MIRSAVVKLQLILSCVLFLSENTAYADYCSYRSDGSTVFCGATDLEACNNMAKRMGGAPCVQKTHGCVEGPVKLQMRCELDSGEIGICLATMYRHASCKTDPKVLDCKCEPAPSTAKEKTQPATESPVELAPPLPQLPVEDQIDKQAKEMNGENPARSLAKLQLRLQVLAKMYDRQNELSLENWKQMKSIAMRALSLKDAANGEIAAFPDHVEKLKSNVETLQFLKVWSDTRLLMLAGNFSEAKHVILTNKDLVSKMTGSTPDHYIKEIDQANAKWKAEKK